MSDREKVALQYRKTALVSAMQFDGTLEGGQAIIQWAGIMNVWWSDRDGLDVCTIEGKLFASKGDWILRGAEGEYWPVKGSIFASTYELAAIAALATPLWSDDAADARRYRYLVKYYVETDDGEDGRMGLILTYRTRAEPHETIDDRLDADMQDDADD